MRTVLVVLAACAIAAPAFAEEPVGCDKFKWPLDKERATLNGTDLPKVTSGDRISWPIPFATAVALRPIADARLPSPPERAPKSPETFAGFLLIPAPARPGTYRITLSSEAWVDVVQNGLTIKSAAFSGATGCEGIRKSVKFVLAAKPFTVEISGVATASIKMVITPD